MKSIYFLMVIIVTTSTTFAQKDFKWEHIDSVPKSKSQIYSETKLFIAQTWNSAKDVIQNDDRDAGIILVRGSSIQSSTFFVYTYTYFYNYDVTFRMKEGRYKITIDNVVCTEARPQAGALYYIPKIQPFDGEYLKLNGNDLPKPKAKEMIEILRGELNYIFWNYTENIKKLIVNQQKEDNW